MIFADKLIALRKKNGWSQEDLAEQMDVSRQSVSKWESGTSIPDLNKIIKLSSLFGVTTDYLLKDDLEELTIVDDAPIKADHPEAVITLETASTYMNLISETAGRFALGICLCVLAAAPLMMLLGFSAASGSRMTEDIAAALGIGILLILVAAGVVLIISMSMKVDRYEYLEKEIFTLDYGVKGVVEKKREDYHSTYIKCTVIGIALCIISPVPLIVGSLIWDSDALSLLFVALLLVLVAGAVYLFVWSGTIHGSFDKLLQEGDYTVENKEVERRTGFWMEIYWCLVTAVYLGFSFTTMRWEQTWIIWPIAAVVCGAIVAAVKLTYRKNDL